MTRKLHLLGITRLQWSRGMYVRPMGPMLVPGLLDLRLTVSDPASD